MFKVMLITFACFVFSNPSLAQTIKTAEQYYSAATKLKESKNYDEALEQYKNAIKANPQYKDALYYAGWVSLELMKYQDALSYLEKAKALSPNDSNVFLEIGYANDKLNKQAEAELNYKKSVSLEKDNPLAYKYLAYLYYNIEKYEDALYNFIKHIQYEEHITSADLYYTKGYCENELGKYNDAIATLNKAIKLNDKNAGNYNELAYAHFKLKNAEDAIKYYNKALSVSASSVIALNGIAEVYRDIKRDIPEAINRYKKTISVDPKNKKAYYWLGWCYNDLEKYNDAVPYLKKAIEIDDKYVSAITELGYTDYALQNYDDALADFKKSMAIEKTQLNVYYSGLCYVGKKQKSEALKMVKELKDMDSDYAKTLQDKIDKM